MSNDFKRLIARKILDVLREPKPGDIDELRRLGELARRHGHLDRSDWAEDFARLFEADDKEKK